MDIVADKFVEYKKTGDINLADEADEDELANVVNNYLDKIEYNMNEDYYNILFYGVKQELQKRGINFAE